MTVWRKEPPTTYHHWLKGPSKIALDPGDWPYPAVRESRLSHDWIELGFCPQPRTSWQWFCYHLGHGIVMRYPLASVVVFAICHSRRRR